MAGVEEIDGGGEERKPKELADILVRYLEAQKELSEVIVHIFQRMQDLEKWRALIKS